MSKILPAKISAPKAPTGAPGGGGAAKDAWMKELFKFNQKMSKLILKNSTITLRIVLCCVLCQVAKAQVWLKQLLNGDILYCWCQSLYWKQLPELQFSNLIFPWALMF